MTAARARTARRGRTSIPTEVLVRDWALRSLVAVAATTALFAAPSSSDGTVERPFAPGGHIQLKLSAADYRIAGTPGSSIRIEWRLDHPEEAAQAGAEVQVTGATAAVVTHSPKNGVHFTISVPFRTNLDLDLSAGDLELTGIQGSQSVSSWAGDVTIDAGKPDQYRVVDASVRFGDISAHPFNFATGGVWRSFSWKGPGQYSLKVRLFAGDLLIR